MKTLLTIALALFYLTGMAQSERKSVVIGSMTSRPNALLIVNPQNSDQGVLLPQLSTGQRMSLKPTSPAEDGLIVFDKNSQAYFYWSEGAWIKLRTDDGKPRFYSIDPVNFHELKPDGNVRHTNMVIFETDNSFVTASRNGLGEEIIAPVDIPHGSIIKELTVYYMDNDAGNNIKVRLLRKRLSGTAEEVVAWESSGNSPNVNSISLEAFKGKEKTDRENYTYRLTVTFDIDNGEEVDLPVEAKQRLYGARIKFEE